MSARIVGGATWRAGFALDGVVDVVAVALGRKAWTVRSAPLTFVSKLCHHSVTPAVRASCGLLKYAALRTRTFHEPIAAAAVRRPS